MLTKPTYRNLTLIIALLFSTLACRAVTRLIIPDTPTPAPTATIIPSLTPTLPPTPSPTIVFESACPALLADIMESATTTGRLSGADGSGHDFTKKEEEDGVLLVTYDVVDNKISDPHLRTVPSDLKDEQSDRPFHEAIWNYFTAVIPPQERELVTAFLVFTDGKQEHLAAVSQTASDPYQWVLEVDILDSKSYYDLTYTLVHEQGHLLTLNSEQVPPSQPVFDNPDNNDIYQQEVDACPQYFPGEGCSNPDSYINQFFNRFWTDIYSEWQVIDLKEGEDVYFDLLDDFYKKYQDQFVTDYAPTNPAEDIAESWAFFILSPKPEPNSIANEKILFFYEYPELVEIRGQILQNVCAVFPQNK